MKKLATFFAVMMALTFSTTAKADLLDGLVGYWPFDGNARDYSGNGNHGNTHGVSLTSDRDGNASSAYYFDGSDYISVADSQSLRIATGNITIAAWIKPIKYGSNTVDESSFITILQKGNDYRFQIGLAKDAPHAIAYVTRATSCVTVSMPSLGNWQFLAVTLNAGTLKYYRNGSFIASEYIGETISSNGGELSIGVDPGGAYEYHIGNMDDVLIYNRALSSSEVSALYNGGLKICAVRFNANNGVGSMEALKVLNGKTLALPASTFTLENYRFVGWSKTKDGEVEYADGAEITVDSDMTLYAVWELDTYKVRLHGNGARTPDGADTWDEVMTFCEPQKLPPNPFTFQGTLEWSRWGGTFLGWSPGTGAFDWPTSKVADLVPKRWDVYATEKYMLDWAQLGWADVTDGCPMLHLYAIWGSVVTVDIKDKEGETLSPKSLAENIKFKIGYDGKWRSGGETVMVPPGKHTLEVRAEPGYEDYLADWSVWEGGIKRSGDGESVFTFTVSSEEGPISIPLEVRLSSVAETGTVRLRCTPQMTQAQAYGLQGFPAFDEHKASIRVRRQLTQSTGALAVEWPPATPVSLPEGTYQAEFGYADRYWRAFPDPELAFTVEAGKETEVEGVYLPYGSDAYYSGWLEECGTLRQTDAGGGTSVAIPAGVSKIAGGAFADAGGIRSMSFGGDAPTVEDGAMAGLSADCVIRVARGTEGWGDVPGTWEGRTLAYDSLAELPEDASEADVAAALGEVALADGVRVASAISGDVSAYADFREWARNAPGGETAVLDSPHAAPAYLLGAEGPFAEEPVITLSGAEVGGGTLLPGAGRDLTVAVSVRDGENEVTVDADKVAELFEATGNLADWIGEARLNPAVEAEPPDGDGTMRFRIDGGTNDILFLRVNVE